MEDNFLCFESDSFLFLYPLERVGYILPSGQVKEGWIEYDNTAVRAVSFRRIWSGCTQEQKEIHVIIGKSREQLYGMIVSQAVGVMAIPEDSHRELPNEMRSEKNRFIVDAAYLKDLKRWAYVVDPDVLLEIEV